MWKGKSSQDYPVNAGVFLSSILGPILFLLYVNDLWDGFIFNIAIYADYTALYSECDQASDLWQQIVLTTVLELDLQDTTDWVSKLIVDFNVRKMQLVLSEISVAIVHQIDGSVLDEKFF